MSAKFLWLAALMMVPTSLAGENPTQTSEMAALAESKVALARHKLTSDADEKQWPWSDEDSGKFQKNRAADEQAREKQLAMMLAEKKAAAEKRAAAAQKAERDAEEARKAAEAKRFKALKEKVAAEAKAKADFKTKQAKDAKDRLTAMIAAKAAAAKKKLVADAAKAKAEKEAAAVEKKIADAKAAAKKAAAKKVADVKAAAEAARKQALRKEAAQEAARAKAAAKAEEEAKAAAIAERVHRENKKAAEQKRKQVAQRWKQQWKHTESEKAEEEAPKQVQEKEGARMLEKAPSAAPTTKVVKLLQELKARAEKDGKSAQKSYDTYACWCESKLAEKAADMNKEKETISEMQVLITKLNGELGAHRAEIDGLKKDLAQNAAARNDAEQVRKNEHAKYDKEKLNLEQQISALEASIKVMTNAGAKKGFLDISTHEAQLLSAVGQVRPVVQGILPSSVPLEDVELLKHFVAKPQDFFSGSSGAMSAMQFKSPNPNGDYAPQSAQIQGIFKGMYDAFTADLEKANVEEAESQKSFESFYETKTNEKETLEASLQTQESYAAEKEERLAESQQKRDDNADLLADDENFFEGTKDACKTKAKEWSVQTRLRTEELNGMESAIKTLSGGAATFKSSFSSFLELSATRKHQEVDQRNSAQVYEKLKALATKYQSLKLAKVAVAAHASGHFDKVFPIIDSMIATLRKEEQEDIDLRDNCEEQENDNKNDIADLTNSIDKTKASLKRMGNTKKELEGEITELAKDIGSTEDSMSDLRKMREKEFKEYQDALNDDTDAVALMKSAISSLSKFYQDNKNLLQMPQQGPEYSVDDDKAPKTSWSGANYGGRKSETTGIVGTLDMLVEDIEKEISEAKADDADAQNKYNKQKEALQATLDSQEETKANTESDLAELEEKMADAGKYKKGKMDDKDAEGDRKKAIYLDCNWVKTSFKSRAKDRKSEIEGLVDAKDFLAGGLR